MCTLIFYNAFFFSSYNIGNLRGKTHVLENRDILKDIRIGMLVALQSKSEVPKVGEVLFLPPNPTLDCTISITLYEQEKAPHKPKWLRYFKITEQNCNVKLADIILYDFGLTNKGAIRKSTREFIQNQLVS